MHLLLFEALAQLGCQFVEQLPDRAIIKIACVLRENLSGKNGNRLTMTWRVTSGIGVEHFSSGDHAGEKRRASCGALPHPPVWEETTSPSRSATKTLRAGLAQAIPARQKPKQSRSKPRPP